MYKQVLQTNYSSFDPLLKVKDVPVKFIGDDDPPLFKYLGRYLQYDLKDNIITRQVEEKLLKWLETIDKTSLDGRMKPGLLTCMFARNWLGY